MIIIKLYARVSYTAAQAGHVAQTIITNIIISNIHGLSNGTLHVLYVIVYEMLVVFYSFASKKNDDDEPRTIHFAIFYPVAGFNGRPVGKCR